MSGPGRLSADEAARRLGVRRDTLYAYVSRGLIRSERQRGTRARLYHAEDVERLARRKQSRRDPERAASQALSFGAPLLESGLTLIRDGQLYYRGLPAEGFIGQAGFEQVAGFLWGGTLATGIDPVVPALPRAFAKPTPALADLPAIERFQVVLAAKAGEDASGYDRSAPGVRRVGAKLLRILTAVSTGGAPSDAPAADVLQRAWAPDRPAVREPLEAALILWADHELNVSTFTVRCVASSGATPYAAVIAGLSALGGPLHGRASEQVEALFDEIERPERARAVLEARLRRGERIPGFGHPLYREGDPRARALLARVRGLDGGSPDLAVADAVERECLRLIARAPNVDFATVALRRALGLPPGAALCLVTIARTAGWIAHAIEQYEAGSLIRPRARYVGEAP
ncbi:MAG: citrate/2-methylcitrate synthase [Myxococcota bacterium]